MLVTVRPLGGTTIFHKDRTLTKHAFSAGLLLANVTRVGGATTNQNLGGNQNVKISKVGADRK